MAHVPVNHPARPFYRFLGGVTGLYLLVFGIAGAARTYGEPFFVRIETEALGLRTNPAFASLSIVVGAIVIIGAINGGNIDHHINLFGGGVFWLSGLVMLAVMQTKANLLNFQVSTCVVSFIVGTLMFLSGMYGKTGTPQEATAEEAFRHSGRGAHVATAKHVFSLHPHVSHGELPEGR